MTTRTRIFMLLAAACAFFPGQSLLAQTRDAGFKPLFNGTNLDGFYIFLGRGPKNSDPDHCVQIENGALHMYQGAANGSQQLFGYISTEKEFSNYHLRFEYKWGTNRFGSRARVKRDAGVIYHMFGPDTVWPGGVECQVQEGDVGDIFTVNTRVTTTVDPKTTNLVTTVSTNQTTGAVRTNQNLQPHFLEPGKGGVTFVQGIASGIRRVIRNPMLEREGWNTVEVIIRNGDVTHIVNGKINNQISAMEHFADGQWLPLTKGKIILQLEGAEVFYRNIEIKELSPTPK